MKLKKEDAKTCLKSNWLTVATFTGVILGLVIGIVIKQSDPEKWNHPDCSKREAMYVGFIGRLFLSALKSIIIPLIVPSLIIAVGTLDLSLSGKIGGRAIAYYMTTTLVSRKISKFMTLHGLIFLGAFLFFFMQISSTPKEGREGIRVISLPGWIS